MHAVVSSKQIRLTKRLKQFELIAGSRVKSGGELSAPLKTQEQEYDVIRNV